MSERATREWRTSPTIQMLRSLERPEPAAQREHVEQGLRRVLVLAVAGVDDARRGPSGHEPGRAGVRAADHDRRRVVGREGLDRVLQRLALVDARAGRADADHVGAEPLGGELEARARAGRGLVEQVDNGPAAERRDLLDLPPGDLDEGLGAIEDPLDPGRSRSSIEIRWRRPLMPRGASLSGVGRGRSSPRRTRRPPRRGRRPAAACEVGRFLPTKSGRIGSSRWPRSISAAS